MSEQKMREALEEIAYGGYFKMDSLVEIARAALAEQPAQGEADVLDGMADRAWQRFEATLAQPEPVAWGMPNTAITGKKMALMMVRLDIPSDDQYGGLMWVPLYTAPPAPAVPMAPPVAFAEWLRSNMPPDTVISDPDWWAMAIWSAARRAINAAPVASGGKASVQWETCESQCTCEVCGTVWTAPGPPR